MKAEVRALSAQGGRGPRLAVILLGDNHASAVYVRTKTLACREVGIDTLDFHLSGDTPQEELLRLVDELNRDGSVDGILIQLPLPPHMDDSTILHSIDREKDVDVFHPYNFGKLVLNIATLLPCTPAGVIALLERSGIAIEGKHAVIVGGSLIVGKPLYFMLLHRWATVTTCHIKTHDVPALTLQADILVAAAGVPRLIKADMVKEGAVVIDVGINRVDGKLVGDVEFEAVRERAAAITPVPGGVGPMTVTMLLRNTLTAYRTLVLGQVVAPRLRMLD